MLMGQPSCKCTGYYWQPSSKFVMSEDVGNQLPNSSRIWATFAHNTNLSEGSETGPLPEGTSLVLGVVCRGDWITPRNICKRVGSLTKEGATFVQYL
jgi:hypothetical protein